MFLVLFYISPLITPISRLITPIIPVIGLGKLAMAPVEEQSVAGQAARGSLNHKDTLLSKAPYPVNHPRL